jgi:O-methyltransferase
MLSTKKLLRSVKTFLAPYYLRTGIRVVRVDNYVRPDNFLSLVGAYEQLFNETIARDHALPSNDRRSKLLIRLQGTTPSEAYYIIKGLYDTAHIVGDVCEFGVAQGETSLLIANEIATSRKVLHLFDSFEGLPNPTDKDKLKDDIYALGSMEAYAGALSFPKQMVIARLRAINFSPERYVIHEGYFENLIPEKRNFPERVAFAYVDFDFYEPIKLSLDYLDTVTPPGAVIIVDDYNFFSTGAKNAVDEFCAEQNQGNEKYRLFVPDARFGHFAVLTKCE